MWLILRKTRLSPKALMTIVAIVILMVWGYALSLRVRVRFVMHSTPTKIELNHPNVNVDWQGPFINATENPQPERDEHSTRNAPLGALNVTDSPIGLQRIQQIENIPPWPCFYVHGKRNTTCKKIKTHFVGAIGNEMFAYASMLGIAKHLNRTPFMPDENIIREIFNLSAEGETSLGVANKSSLTWTRQWEQHSNKHDDEVEQKLNTSVDIELVGYFQSWRYFQDIEALVKSEFRFNDVIQQQTEDYIRGLIRDQFGNETKREHVTLVGIHVRRGDMLKPNRRAMGYIVADRQYMDRAISYFENTVQANGSKKMMFVVCLAPEEDTRNWTRQNVVSQKNPVVIHEAASGGQDLAVLASCNHVIQTVGTFGWWAAWLAGGQSTYFQGFPTPDTSLANSFDAAEYYVPNWIPL